MTRHHHPVSSATSPLLLMLSIVIFVAVLHQASACPFASFGRGMPRDMQHFIRKMMPRGGADRSATAGAGLQAGPFPVPTCRASEIGLNRCDPIPGISFTPTFYEDKGCVGGDGLWGTIVKALDSFNHPQYGATFTRDCLAPMIRNVFHMDVSLGHNARMFLEDYGSKRNPSSTPDSNPSTSRSAKLAGPNRTLRCYDVYEHLRTEVDKYTAQRCPTVYVSCTDLANYAARYAHWKLSGGKFLPCFNYGFADDEPLDFAGDSFQKNLTPRQAAEKCLPPHDSADLSGGSDIGKALSKDKFNAFYNTAMRAFSSPCYSTPKPLGNVDLANILTGHTVGEAHCHNIRIGDVKEPFMNTTFWQKLTSDCNKCRAAVAAGTAVKPYGSFDSNLNSNSFSFAQKCKTAGQQDYLPVGQTTGINRVETFPDIQVGGRADPCCVPNDVFTKDEFDFQYFPQVVNSFGLFEVDNGLPVSGDTQVLTLKWARCNESVNLFTTYQRTWNKMNLIGGKPYDGKRRKYCSVPTWARLPTAEQPVAIVQQ